MFGKSKFNGGGGRKLALALLAVALVVASGVAWDGHHTFSGSGYQSYQENIPGAVKGRYDAKATLSDGTQTQSTIYLGIGRQITATANPGQTSCVQNIIDPDPLSNHTWYTHADLDGSGTAEVWGQDPKSLQSRLCPDKDPNSPDPDGGN
jgi:hypothetical protein